MFEKLSGSFLSEGGLQLHTMKESYFGLYRTDGKVDINLDQVDFFFGGRWCKNSAPTHTVPEAI